MHDTTIEIEDLADLAQLLAERVDLSGVVLNGLELDHVSAQLRSCNLRGAVLIGCSASPELLAFATLSGAAVFPSFGEMPYRPYRRSLYDALDLYDSFDPLRQDSYADTLDAKVYRHWKETGGVECTDLLENLGRRIHDYSITDAIEGLIDGRNVAAIMGGHGLQRDHDGYAAVARIARRLARLGVLMASGGGPGAMEATHLGSWMAPYDDDDLGSALTALRTAPGFEATFEWLATAFAVRSQFPARDDSPISLGIPTWLYGHEPPNVFATHIAKYFANAAREDGLLTIARHGVIFTPGSAGTVQEIFQDATQNHYETAGPPSPMVFFGTRFWRDELPVMDVINNLSRGRDWAGHVVVTDDENEVVEAIANHRRT